MCISVCLRGCGGSSRVAQSAAAVCELSVLVAGRLIVTSA